MDVFSIIGLASGVCIGLFSGAATFFNKQRFVAQIELLQQGNNELRGQNADLRAEQGDLKSQITEFKVKSDEREKVISEYKRQPNFAQVTKLISNNHTQVINKLADITKILAGKIEK